MRRNMESRVERQLSQSRERGPIQFRHPEKAGEAIRQSIDENIEREAVIDRRALEAKALQHAMGQADLHRIRAESERFQQDGRLIVAGDSVNSPRGAYTTPEMIALERSNIDLMRAGQGQSSSHWHTRTRSGDGRASDNLLPIRPLSPRLLSLLPTGSLQLKVAPALRKRQLSAQSASSRKSRDTRCTDSLLQRARSSRFPRRAFPREPSPVSSKAKRGHASKQIWVIDESSLLPTRQVNRILHKAREESVERIIFVGDQRQHHAIEAGRPDPPNARGGNAGRPLGHDSPTARP